MHGYPALVGALEHGIHVHATPSEHNQFTLAIPAWNTYITLRRHFQANKIRWLYENCPDTSGLIAQAFSVIVNAMPIPTPLAITATVELPARAGLGSSAALAVAITRLLAQHSTNPTSSAHIAETANAAETIFHNNPSGVDVSLALRGGFGVYDRRQGFQKLPLSPISVAVGLSGQLRNTSTMISTIAKAQQLYPAETTRRLETLGALTTSGTQALQHRDLPRLGALMQKAHKVLTSLQVSTPKLNTMVQAACRAGAFGAKLTGAGGGGAVIALCPGIEIDILNTWKQAGIRGFITRVGVPVKNPP